MSVYEFKLPYKNFILKWFNLLFSLSQGKFNVAKIQDKNQMYTSESFPLFLNNNSRPLSVAIMYYISTNIYT